MLQFQFRLDDTVFLFHSFGALVVISSISVVNHSSNDPLAPDREVVGSNGAPKRQRRWNAETVKVPEQQTYTLITSSPSKDAFHLTPRRTLTKSVPKPVENSQKERIGELKRLYVHCVYSISK